MKQKPMKQKLKNIIKLLLSITLFFTAVPFALGFLNFMHPLFDSFSHFRVHLLILILPLLFLLSFFYKKPMKIFYLLSFLGASLYLYFILQPFHAEPLDETKTKQLKHIQFNLNFRNQEMERVVAYFEKSNADVITLEEVTQAHQQQLLAMKSEAYPYQKHCAFYPVVGGVSILSKHPFNPKHSICLEGKGLVWSQIVVEEQPINIVAIHTLWPYPHGQSRQIDEIKSIFKQIKTPTLIAGDFNAASWSQTVKKIEKASKTKVIEGMRWTIDLRKQVPLIPNFKLAIDHLLISKEFQVAKIFVEKDLGSDHLPVVTELRYK